jgi:putative transposase
VTVDFCVEALEVAIDTHGCPEIFNSEQGSQFTSNEFADVLKADDIQISMDGGGRWVDNVIVDRLWRSVEYEEVHLHAYKSVAEACKGFDRYFQFSNSVRRHSAH